MGLPSRFIYAGPAYGARERFVPAPLLRRRFTAFAPTGAKLVITGLGYYAVFLNGRELTKGPLAPYISAPTDLVYYDEYDLLPYLRTGDNVLCVLLGNGFQNDFAGYVWDFDRAVWRGAPRTALRLTLTEPDGETVIESDDRFQAASSPILMDNTRYGEHYDARLERPELHDPAAPCDDLPHAQLCDAPTGEKRLCDCEPIVVEREIAPVSVTLTDEGALYDFGENNAGVCRLSIDGHAGQRLELYFGEHRVGDRLDMTNVKFEGRFGADDLVQKNVYICKDGPQTHTPRFTYQGFRYALVKGLRPEQATPALLTYLVMHSGVSLRGELRTSDSTVNAIQAMTVRSTLSNLHYFPTDCPHREKNGWTGDAALSCEQMLLNFDASRIYLEWLRNIRKAQAENGMLPGIVPTGGWGFDWGNGPAWDAVIVFLPYYLYRYTGNRQAVEDNIPAIWRYLRYMYTRRDPQGLFAFGLADWVSVNRPPEDPKCPLVVTDTLICLDIARKSAELFGVLDMAPERAYALRLADEIFRAARRHLLEPETGMALGYCQTAQAMALYHGLFTPEEEPAAYASLLKLIHEQDDHMDIGFLGMRVIFDVLFDHGDGELAYRMITRPDFPSYGAWAERGATTLREIFHADESGKVGSLNHHCWGDVSRVFYERLLGLRVNPGLSSPNELLLQPFFPAAMQSAEGYHALPAGKASVSWRREGDRVRYRLALPDGATGTLRAPRGYAFPGGETALPARSGEYLLAPQPAPLRDA